MPLVERLDAELNHLFHAYAHIASIHTHTHAYTRAHGTHTYTQPFEHTHRSEPFTIIMAEEGLTEGPIPVWLDCDPGHDDALAIILAGHSPAIDLFGVSTVHGNVPVALTTKNALSTLQVAGLLGSIPVVQGQAVPIMRPSRVCPEIHGATGLDGFDFPSLPDDVRPVEGKAIAVMYDRIAAKVVTAGRSVTLVATGCLTNVALLLVVYPEVKAHLNRIVLMGG